MLTTFCIAMIISAMRWPVPRIHDDFSYLLLADTLSLGRVCNPTPPASVSLETFHVVFTPTYTSKFPIGPALLLCIGNTVAGSPVVGLWLSAALATGCLAWMLASIFTPRWVLGVGMLLSIHPSWQNGWSQEYTHGWLPLAGSALVLGGILRLRNRMVRNRVYRTKAYWIAAAIGMGGLLTLFSRPFDGGIVCFLLVISLFSRIFSEKWYAQSVFWKSMLITTALLFIGAIVQIGINQQVTHRWTQLPYQLHEQQYGVAPLFVGSQPHEPSLGHRFQEIENFHRDCSLQSWTRASSLRGYFEVLVLRIRNMVSHWGYLLSCLPLIVLMLQHYRRRFGWLWIVAVISIFAINAVPWVMPAYVAALIPISLLLSCIGVRAVLRLWIRQCSLSVRATTNKAQVQFQSRRQVEWLVAGILALAQLSSFGASTMARATYQKGWEKDWADNRHDLEKQLMSTPGQHLVMVQYGSEHNVHEEWVYNSAEPASAKIVWARNGTADLNESLLNNYADRVIWALDADRVLMTRLRSAN